MIARDGIDLRTPSRSGGIGSEWRTGRERRGGGAPGVVRSLMIWRVEIGGFLPSPRRRSSVVRGRFGGTAGGFRPTEPLARARRPGDARVPPALTGCEPALVRMRAGPPRRKDAPFPGRPFSGRAMGIGFRLRIGQREMALRGIARAPRIEDPSVGNEDGGMPGRPGCRTGRRRSRRVRGGAEGAKPCARAAGGRSSVRQGRDGRGLARAGSPRSMRGAARARGRGLARGRRPAAPHPSAANPGRRTDAERRGRQRPPGRAARELDEE